jgi:RNA polymerase sigma-70 factor, ECF subfamily
MPGAFAIERICCFPFEKVGVCSSHPRLRMLRMDTRTARSILNDLPQLEAKDASAGASGRRSMAPILSRLKSRFKSDEELVELFRSGEAEALTVLFERHSALVFRIARRILDSNDEAEDVVQQVFLDLFRSMAKFDPARGTFKVWLLMFAYHRAINHRRGLRAARFYDCEDLEEVLESRADSNRPVPCQETAHLVREALEQIQPRQREVIELVYYEGRTPEEIAAQTGDSVGVVRHNLYRGLEKARAILASVRSEKEKKARKAKRP